MSKNKTIYILNAAVIFLVIGLMATIVSCNIKRVEYTKEEKGLQILQGIHEIVENAILENEMQEDIDIWVGQNAYRGILIGYKGEFLNEEIEKLLPNVYDCIKNEFSSFEKLQSIAAQSSSYGIMLYINKDSSIEIVIGDKYGKCQKCLSLNDEFRR